MNNLTVSNFDLMLFIVELVLAISAFYAAWINLFYKKISKIGFDAFILLFFERRKAKRIKEDPRLIKRMGIITLLIALGSLSEVVSIFTGKIWPYMS